MKGHLDMSMEQSPESGLCALRYIPPSILDFVDSERWAIVVMGDKGMAPFHVKGIHTFFLDVVKQEALAQQFLRFSACLPWNHFGRKNMRYLFAILHGAEQIWDFDDDNFLKNRKEWRRDRK